MVNKFNCFASIIKPILADEFFSAYWEKQPLHIKRDHADFYNNLITLQDVQTTLAHGGLRYPAVQLSKSGRFIHPDVFCQDIRAGEIVFNGVPDLQKLLAEYKSGASLSLPGFNRVWPPLMNLAAAIEDELSHAVHCNIYITPGNTSGFTPHYDAHEVFILQISGNKHWKIYAPPLTLPHFSQPFNPSLLPAKAAVMELDLQAGDLLYLPRGFVHAANTLDDASMHVTLGVTMYTYVELIGAWLQTSKLQPAMRKALPPGFAKHPALQTQIESELRSLITAFTQQLDGKQVVDDFFQRVRAGYPGKSEIPQTIDLNVSVIDDNTPLTTLPATAYSITEEGENLVLAFADKTIVMPARALPLLDEMRQRESFCALDLTSNFKQDTKLKLIKHLYQEGFIKLLS